MSSLICLSCRALCDEGTVKQHSQAIHWGGVKYKADVLDQCPHCDAVDELREFDLDEALVEVESLTAAVRALVGRNDPKLRALEARIANIQSYLEEA